MTSVSGIGRGRESIMTTPVGQGTLLARSLLTGTKLNIPISAVIYAFTVGAARGTIDTVVFKRQVFLPAEVYIRTRNDLLWLERFKSLAALQRMLPDSFAILNRGVLVNLSFLLNFPTVRHDHGLGLWLNDHQGVTQEDRIRLSDDGRRIVDSFALNPSHSTGDTEPVPPDADKRPPDDRVSPAD
jgi:hypothetical protein